MSNTRTYYRRHLPHWQPPGATIFLTWRLYGSLPREALDRIAEERQYLEHLPLQPSETRRDRAMRHSKKLLSFVDDMLGANDAAVRWLGDQQVANLVVDSFFFHADRLYTLLAFVVMPSHVHLLLTPLAVERAIQSQAGKPDPRHSSQAGKPDPQYVPLAKITQSLKGYTAREGNRILGRTGQPFWQDESYDHCPRSEQEVGRIAAYIEGDPVRSGLVTTPQDWRWSSAWERTCGRLT